MDEGCGATLFFATRLFHLIIKWRTDSSIKTDEIESAQSYKRINNACQPCTISKQKRHQIKLEKANESPYNASDDSQCKKRIIKPFHVFYLLLFLFMIQYFQKYEKYTITRILYLKCRNGKIETVQKWGESLGK